MSSPNTRPSGVAGSVEQSRAGVEVHPGILLDVDTVRAEPAVCRLPTWRVSGGPVSTVGGVGSGFVMW